MITLFGFRRIFREGIGETKDLRVEWALKETGLDYRVHGLDHTGGELDSEAYRAMSCFRQVPVIDDDGFVVDRDRWIVVGRSRFGGCGERVLHIDAHTGVVLVDHVRHRLLRRR